MDWQASTKACQSMFWINQLRIVPYSGIGGNSSLLIWLRSSGKMWFYILPAVYLGRIKRPKGSAFDKEAHLVFEGMPHGKTATPPPDGGITVRCSPGYIKLYLCAAPAIHHYLFSALQMASCSGETMDHLFYSVSVYSRSCLFMSILPHTPLGDMRRMPH